MSIARRAGAPVTIEFALTSRAVSAGVEALEECEESGTSTSLLVEEVFRAVVRQLSVKHADLGAVRLKVCPSAPGIDIGLDTDGDRD